MIDWQPYLSSIAIHYQKWWETYTITDVVDKISPRQQQGIFLELRVQEVKPERDNRQEVPERLDIRIGLRKYSLDQGNHVLLQGKPGSGKSTALARLLLEECEQVEKRSDLKIPVLVQLRYYQTSILDLMGQFLREHGMSLSTDEIKTCLQQKQFFLLIDGINELPSNEATTELKKFRKTYQTVPMVFTTRELGLRGDLEIEKKLAMESLTDTQMRDFVKGYLGDEGENLLSQLGNERLKRLGETPLLLWMLCSIYRQNQQELPKNLGETFRAFTGLYDNKLKGDVTTQTDSQVLWSYSLQYLAFAMTKAQDEPAILQGEAEKIIREFLSQNEQDSSLSKSCLWLQDLINHHLLQRKGEDKIEFHHQLIQEYYAAEYLLRENISSLTPLKKGGEYGLSDEELQRDYLNYLKWTETLALMLGLVEDAAQAVRVVKLGLGVDWQLGARLAGEVRKPFQVKTVQCVLELNLPQLLRVRLLGLTGSDAAIPSLINALEDSYHGVRWSAVKALGKIGTETAIPSLNKALEDSDEYVRSSAVEALGKIGTETAIPSLNKALEDSNEYVRSSAAEALGYIGTETAIPSLNKALEDSDEDVRSSAAEALGNIGTETAITSLNKALEDSDYYVRSSAASALGNIGTETAITSLINALEHSNSLVRGNAASALGNIGTETAIPSLLKALKDSDKYVRSCAAYALGKIGTETAITSLINALEDSASGVRSHAVEALGKIGTQTATASLIKALEDSDEYVRSSAAEALGNIGTETAIPSLLKALEDSDFLVRSSAAEALGKIGTETAIPSLLKALEDSDEYVRSSAAIALGKIGTETAIPSLIKALEDSDFLVRSSAAEALGNIGTETAIPSLINALEHSDSNVRSRAAEALGNIGNTKTLWQLKQLLNKPEFLLINNSETALETLNAIQTIQKSNHCKIYHPKFLMNINPSEVFISYAWRGESEELANQLETAFQERGITIIRDKKELGYKGLIKEFMQRIGQGKCVILIISDRYLKSENCIFELLEIYKKGEFIERIFPVVLSDAKIYEAIDRLDYCRHWEQKIQQLEDAMKQGSLVNLQGITDDLNLYTEIRNNLGQLTNILKNINTLTPDIHRASNFDAIIKAVTEKISE